MNFFGQRPLKGIRDGAYAALFWSIFAVFRRLSLPNASRFGGWIGKCVGPYTAFNGIAQTNLAKIFPSIPVLKREQILLDIWDHWGRFIGEYAHLVDLMGGYVSSAGFPVFPKTSPYFTVHGKDVLETLKQEGGPAVFFSAHLSHFQLIAGAALQNGLPMGQFYRQSQNVWIDRYMYALQSQLAEDVIAKGYTGMRHLLRALQAGKRILILLDQKDSAGAMVPFLGHPASTSTLIATLCKKKEYPLIPVRVHRTSVNPLRFDITFYPPLDLAPAPEEIMVTVNNHLSAWIREAPEQWLWLYPRWPFSSD